MGLSELKEKALSNSEISETFHLIADLMTFKEENRFRISAYQRVGRVVRKLETPASDMSLKELKELEGVGKETAQLIKDLSETGQCNVLDDLLSDLPGELPALLTLSGIGPKTLKKLYNALGDLSEEDLLEKAEQQQLRTIKGLGPSVEATLIEAIQFRRSQKNRWRYASVEREWLKLKDRVGSLHLEGQLLSVGAYFQGEETPKTLEVFWVGTNSSLAKLMDFFEENYKPLELESIQSLVRDQATLKQAFKCVNGLPLLLYYEKKEAKLANLFKLRCESEYWEAFQKKAGLKDILKKLESLELSITNKDLESVAFESSDYGAPPSERRWKAQHLDEWLNGDYQSLIQLSDLRGDLHMHSTDSDGRHSSQSMLETAKSLGHDYIAMTNHSQLQRLANGLDPERLKTHTADLETIEAQESSMRLLKGIEVDILPDGSLDLPDESLGSLDWVVASVHNQLNLPKEKMTQRLLKAIEHPSVNAIGHPSGRLLLERAEAQIDWEQVFEKAAETKTALEINSAIARMDLSAEHIEAARAYDVTFVISTDAHHESQLSYQKYGILNARRAGLSKKQVLNTKAVNHLLESK